jgi:hypothetical protein
MIRELATLMAVCSLGCAQVRVDAVGASCEPSGLTKEQEGPFYDGHGEAHYADEMTVTPGEIVRQFVDVPDGVVITDVSIELDPEDRDRADDLFLPSISFDKYSVANSFAVTELGAVVDSSTSPADYSEPHTLRVCTREVHDRDSFMYYVTFGAETGSYAKPARISRATVGYAEP